MNGVDYNGDLINLEQDAHGDAQISIGDLETLAVADTNIFSAGSQGLVDVNTDTDSDVNIGDVDAVVDDDVNDESGDVASIAIFDIDVQANSVTDAFSPGSQGEIDIFTESDSEPDIDNLNADVGADGSESISLSDVAVEADSTTHAFTPGAQDVIEIDTDADADLDTDSVDSYGAGTGELQADADAETLIFVPGGQGSVDVESDADAEVDGMDDSADALTGYFDPNGGGAFTASANGSPDTVTEYTNMGSDWFQTGAGTDSTTVTREELFDGSTEAPDFDYVDGNTTDTIDQYVINDPYDQFLNTGDGGEPTDDGSPYVFQGSSDYWYDNTQSQLFTGLTGTFDATI